MFYRLSDLKRYNNLCRVKSESLAEHHYYCALILLKLKKHLNNISDNDFNILLQYILIHDIGELITGDVPHKIKYENPDLKNIVNNIEDEYIKSLGFTDIISEIEYKKYLHHIFKLCDNIQVLQYCINEMSLGNNTKDINRICNETINCVNDYITILVDLNYFNSNFDLDAFMEEL